MAGSCIHVCHRGWKGCRLSLPPRRPWKEFTLPLHTRLWLGVTWKSCSHTLCTRLSQLPLLPSVIQGLFLYICELYARSQSYMTHIVYNTIQYNTIQYNTIQYNTIQCSTIQYNTIQYNTENFYSAGILGVAKFKGASSPKPWDRKHMYRGKPYWSSRDQEVN